MFIVILVVSNFGFDGGILVLIIPFPAYILPSTLAVYAIFKIVKILISKIWS